MGAIAQMGEPQYSFPCHHAALQGFYRVPDPIKIALGGRNGAMAPVPNSTSFDLLIIFAFLNLNLLVSH